MFYDHLINSQIAEVIKAEFLVYQVISVKYPMRFKQSVFIIETEADLSVFNVILVVRTLMLIFNFKDNCVILKT